MKGFLIKFLRLLTDFITDDGDVKFNSWEELYEGKNFMIIELNGSGSEPTHIYDPSKKNRTGLILNNFAALENYVPDFVANQKMVWRIYR